MIERVFWRAFTRDALPSALFGFPKQQFESKVFSHPSEVPSELIAVAYQSPVTANYSPPSLMVLDDKTAPELFSWLSVYAPQTSPLSQFARIVGHSDFELLQASQRVSSTEHRRSDRWASVALGEILAQGDADVELNSIPISRASACFSTAMGKVAMIYSGRAASSLCSGRLAALEADVRFARRPVSVQELLLGWNILGNTGEHVSGAVDAAKTVFEGVSIYSKDFLGVANPALDLSQYPGLNSDSVEERVVTFNRMVTEVLHASDEPKTRYLLSALLGAAAFLVGRGTSHVFLLGRHAKSFPSSYAWFGVVAAIAGPQTWDAHWSRISKSIERGLRTRFEWADPPAVDLCWSEFAWMADSFYGGGEIFAEMPKISPRVLSIEIIPGVTCQLRLASNTHPSADTDRQRSPSSIDPDLQALLTQFISLAGKARVFADPTSKTPLPVQRSLDLPEEPIYKNARPKKGKRV